MAVICWNRLVGAYIKNACSSNQLHQKPLAHISNLASSAMMSHSSYIRIWRMDRYSPMRHDSVWPNVMINTCPQTQCKASCGGSQPQHKQRASGILLCGGWSHNYWLAVSQVDAPSSVANSTYNIQSLLPVHGHLPITSWTLYALQTSELL